ncbi:hypothetical protein E6C50_15210 [Flavobacterium supellecticarium]|uniref:DUF2892 domain-containing protein n=1 Tax=Flavobacterium supellecticarium TaxID=2565924 RepID=A0A4S3ZRI5_9FLAO|nr:hypothetical protein [Flavobacterium supellecticarium]THF48190.1 hypothetical protein E6C50_15210 [Flavobacterium supellecticarium]
MKNLFSNWHFMRYFRLAIALFMFYTAYENREWLFGVFGLFFLLQAIFNFGCNNNQCSIPNKTRR